MRNQTSNPKWCKTYVPSKDATKEFDLPEESKIEPAAKKPEEYEQWYYLDEEFNLIELP